MLITNENFIEAIKSKDESALSYVLDEYGSIIKTVVSKHLYQFESCQGECINDILMAIWANIDYFDPNKSTFKNWVAGIAKYKALNYVRKYMRELNYETLDHEVLDKDKTRQDDSVYLEVIQDELDEDMCQMLSYLKPTDQQLFMKLYVQGQAIEQVSLDLDMQPTAIYNRLSRAKGKLKKLFN